MRNGDLVPLPFLVGFRTPDASEAERQQRAVALAGVAARFVQNCTLSQEAKKIRRFTNGGIWKISALHAKFGDSGSKTLFQNQFER